MTIRLGNALLLSNDTSSYYLEASNTFLLYKQLKNESSRGLSWISRNFRKQIGIREACRIKTWFYLAMSRQTSPLGANFIFPNVPVIYYVNRIDRFFIFVYADKVIHVDASFSPTYLFQLLPLLGPLTKNNRLKKTQRG